MKRFLAMALALLMVISVTSMSVMAAVPELNLGTGSCDYYNLIEKNDYSLAPGAVESEIILNDDSGTRRQVVHVVEVDPNNDNISVMPSFKNIGNGVDYTDTNNWGIMEMSKQAAYVEETLGKNVVAAMNVCLSWDFTHPYGLLVYEGEVLCDNRFSCDSCGNNGHPGGGYLVIYKDGKAELRDAKADLTGDEWMAQTVCFSFLVKDGKNLAEKEDHTSEAAPRSVIGVKADGSLVIMMVDGRMAPYSTGFTSHEMAQMMLDLGCVDAINCDGGGSSTFITEREGTGELSVKSRFSDGSERPTLTGIVIVSKAVADGKFDHASIEADNKLVTPGSTVTFTATGADSAGGPAEVPENVSWQLTDSSMGTIANGVFVSSGKTGSVTAQMVYEGNVVGEATIDVVIPDSFAFVMPNITAPYTKTVSLDVVAKYGHTEVALKASDVEYVLSDAAMGTINGTKFTATSDETVKGGTVTATLVHDRALTATANITLGKGSEIVYDFESGADSIANWILAYKGVYTPDKYYFNDQLSVASAEDGAKVRNGQYALKVTVDGDSITCMNWCQTKIQGMNIDLTDAVSLSFWIYIPEGSHGLEWDFGNAIPVVLGHEFQYGTGWQYLTVNVKDIGTNVTNLNEIRLYHSDTNNAGNGYNHYEHPNYYADVVYYIDDITVNYSSAVEDNDAPVISNACVSHANVDTGVAMKGQDIDTSLVTFTAKATDNVGNTNYTGLDLNSLIVLVDGKQINATCSDNGMIATDNIDLANGVHTVVFQIADNNGNYNMYKEYSINIVGNDDKNTIKYVPADPTLKDVLQDSVVWMNLVATAIDKVGTVTTTIDLDQNSKWELDHMILADGFTAEYTIDPENNDATITITATGNVALSGEAIIASLPIRVWSPAFINGGNEDSSSYRLVSVMSYVQMGELVETDGAVSLFASAMQTVSTEWNSTRLTSTFDKSGWHIHTAEAVEDKAPTCSAHGYTGRTFCNECNSVVDWGTTVPAAGHTYALVDGKFVCAECGDVFIPGTGAFSVNGKLYFAIAGKLISGWQQIGDNWHYFDDVTFTTVSTKTFDFSGTKVTYDFNEDGTIVSGKWLELPLGWRYYYGPDCYKLKSYQGNVIFVEIDGKTYGFNGMGFRYEGVCFCKETSLPTALYVFGEDGVYQGKYTGIYEDLYYLDGAKTSNAGLIKFGDDYYYITTGAKPYVGNLYVTEAKANGLVPAGKYTFAADGKMVIEAPKEGIVNGKYYVGGQLAKNAGAVKVGDDYYYITATGSVYVGKISIGEVKTNGLIPAGSYDTDDSGKLIIVAVKDGIVNGKYYVGGQLAKNAGAVKVGDDYYYITATGSVYVGKISIGEVKTNGLIPAGSYETDEDGKLIIK